MASIQGECISLQQEKIDCKFSNLYPFSSFFNSLCSYKIMYEIWSELCRWFGCPCFIALEAYGVFGWNTNILQCFPLTYTFPQLLSLSKRHHIQKRLIPTSPIICLSYRYSVLSTGRPPECKTPLRLWEESNIYGTRIFLIKKKKGCAGKQWCKNTNVEV